VAGPVASLLSCVRGIATAGDHTRASVTLEGVSAALSGGTGRHGRLQGLLNRLRTLGRRVTTVQAHCKGHRPLEPAPNIGATGHEGVPAGWDLGLALVANRIGRNSGLCS
jgi:hypothetical protein